MFCKNILIVAYTNVGYATMGGSWPHNEFSVIIVQYDNANYIAEQQHI